MDVGMLDAAGQALLIILDPYRMMMVSAGVLMGLALGIIPGIGGLVGMAMLLPFTFTMDPYTAFALLLGLLSVIGTDDPDHAALRRRLHAGRRARAMEVDPDLRDPLRHHRMGGVPPAVAWVWPQTLLGDMFPVLKAIPSM